MNIEKMYEEYKQGATNKELALKYNVHRTTIQRWLKKAEIPLRSKEQTARKHNILNFKNGVCTQNDAYILGIIFADGNLSRNCIEVSLHEKDRQILTDISNYVYGYEKLSYRKARKWKVGNKTYNSSGQWRLFITSKSLVEKLKPLGLKENKSLTLEYPPINGKYDRDFIRGYFDGDGCISNPNNLRSMRISIVGSHKFCKSLHKKLSHYLDINVKLKNKTDNVSCVEIYGRNQVETFCDWLYKESDLKMDRKYKRYLKLKQ